MVEAEVVPETTRTNGFTVEYHTPLLFWGLHKFSPVYNLTLKSNTWLQTSKGLHQYYTKTVTSHTWKFPTEFQKEIITGSEVINQHSSIITTVLLTFATISFPTRA